jgi:D-alanyl-lipoteichoic acid acyltransferase DltB (MBOAT superfamily)
MPITSLRFFAFTLVALILYYWVPKKIQNQLLLLISFLFYGLWAWHFPIVLLIVIFITYFLARAIVHQNHPRRLLWLGISVNLLLLGYLKHYGFFLEKIETLIGDPSVVSVLRGWEILFPLGMSYYSLQAISYLVDVSRGQIRTIPPFMHFALYLGYFPKMLSGPIERAGPFLSQLARKRVLNNQTLARSFTLVMLGLARKMLIANPLAAIIQGDYFSSPWKYNSIELAVNLIAFSFMLYNDFTGYTSIVRGVSGFFGIELSANFRQPFFSGNFTELWTRWHITLSSWLRDYIYLPLTRVFLRRQTNPRALPTLVVPPLVTLVASAAWHGVTRNILFWGLLMGSLIAAERVLQSRRPFTNVRPLWRRLISWGLTTGLMLATLVPFVGTLATTKSYWWGLVSRWNSFTIDGRIVVLCAISFGADLVMIKDQEMVFLRWPKYVQAGLLTITILGLFLVSQADFRSPFVYQGF